MAVYERACLAGDDMSVPPSRQQWRQVRTPGHDMSVPLSYRAIPLCDLIGAQPKS